VDVLVIQTDDELRGAIIEALEGSGLTARGIESPKGATRAIVRKEAKLVVISMDLPDIRGDHLVSLLRGVDRLSELRMVMATSGDCPSTLRLATCAGADAVFQTADDLSVLVDMVRALLGLRAVSGARRRPELPPKR